MSAPSSPPNRLLDLEAMRSFGAADARVTEIDGSIGIMRHCRRLWLAETSGRDGMDGEGR